MGQFSPLAIVLLFLLVIPATILVGYRRPNGSVAISSGAALVAIAAFWLLGGTAIFYGGNSPNSLVNLLLFCAGMLLLLTCWTLSINAAAQARRWLWVTLLILSGLLTFGIEIFLLSSPVQTLCLFPPPPTVPASDAPVFGTQVILTCQPVNPLLPALIVAGCFAGPLAALVYATRPSLLTLRSLRLRRQHQLPEGLTVSRLGAGRDPAAEPDMF